MAVDASYQPKTHHRQGGDEFVVASGGTLTVESGGAIVSAAIALSDADATILAANSGKIHIIANVSANRTFTLPTAAVGLYYEFWYREVAADTDDWLIVTGSDTNFYLGAVLFSDVNSDNTIAARPNGTDDATIQVVNPDSGTIVKTYCDGTNWFLSGHVLALTTPTFT